MPHVKTLQTCGSRILFTGPDGIGDYRARLIDFPRYIGIGPLSPEGTSDLSYLCRPALCNLPPMPKHCFTGEVGWGLQYHQHLNRQTLHSNMQIKLQMTTDFYHNYQFLNASYATSSYEWEKAEFRSALEDRVTQRYQNPWHAPPHFPDKQSVQVYDKPAWTCKVDRNSQDNNKLFLLNKRYNLAQKKPDCAAHMSSRHFPAIVQVKNRK